MSVIGTVRAVRDSRQRIVLDWVRRVFAGLPGVSTPFARTERVLEEVIELAQATDFPKERIHELVELVYARDKGEVAQELGGVSIALLAYAQVMEQSLDHCENTELARVLAKPDSYYAVRLSNKIAAGIVTEVV
jgi:NTP pyrophosphatase (non-canonical NTP hydrolase)